MGSSVCLLSVVITLVVRKLWLVVSAFHWVRHLQPLCTRPQAPQLLKNAVCLDLFTEGEDLCVPGIYYW